MENRLRREDSGGGVLQGYKLSCFLARCGSLKILKTFTVNSLCQIGQDCFLSKATSHYKVDCTYIKTNLDQQVYGAIAQLPSWFSKFSTLCLFLFIYFYFSEFTILQFIGLYPF